MSNGHIYLRLAAPEGWQALRSQLEGGLAAVAESWRVPLTSGFQLLTDADTSTERQLPNKIEHFIYLKRKNTSAEMLCQSLSTY